MEFKELIYERHSIRKYAEEAVPQEVIETILTQAQQAPSWKNFQSARSYVVSSPEKLAEVKTKCLPEFNQKSSENAVLIVTTYVRGLSGFSPDGTQDNELGDTWGAYDLGIRDAYIALAARDNGYDTLIMGIRDEKAVREVLQIPENETVMSVIALGKRRQDPRPRPRKEIAEVTKFF